MDAPPVESLSSWLQFLAPSRIYLLLALRNAGGVALAYQGCEFQAAFLAAARERLHPYGVRSGDILVLDHAVLVGLDSSILDTSLDRDLFLERLKAALCYEPVQCGSEQILINVALAWVGGAGERPACWSDLHSLANIIAFSEVEPSVCEQTRCDMALATRFYADMREEKIVLAFQPVVLVENHRPVLYYEVLLRWGGADKDIKPVSCAPVVQAIERLHGTGRLDASVLWSVLCLLERHPDIELACNISPLSLQHGSWWRLIIAALERAPQLASRLILEITETAAVFDLDAATNLLGTIRKLGCKVALDDVGAGLNTLELARQIHPDFIKIDQSLVHQARGRDGLAALHDWIHTSRCISPCVITEGVETALDFQQCVAAGARAIQGYFIEPSCVQPSWRLMEPFFVQDYFSYMHHNVAMRRFNDF